MNLFQNILNKVAPDPKSTFLSGFTPSTPQAQKPQSQTVNFIPKANAGEPLVSDQEIDEMIKQWASDSEIEMIIREMEKERSKPSQVQQPVPQQSIIQKAWNMLQWVWQAWVNISWWAIEWGINALWNTAWFLSKVWWFVKWDSPESIQASWDYIQWITKQWTDLVKSNSRYNPESLWSSVWKVWANILTTVIWPWKIFKTAEKANMAIKALAWLANTSIEGTTAAVTNYVTQEWRLPTAKEVAEFIAVQGWVKTIWNIAWQVKKLPSARLIPTTITEAGKDIRKGIDIGEAISKTGISFTKWQLIKKVEKISQNLSKNVDSAIQRVIDKTWPNNVTISSLTKWLKSEIMSDSAIKAQLKGTPIQMPQIEETIDETITAYKKLYWAKKFDLNAQQQLKKDIYAGLESVFNKNFQTTWKITAQQATERQIARKLRENIEVKVPEVVALNKQLAPYLEAGKRLNAKGGYSGYLTDILAWWFAWWSPWGIISDPVGYAKNFLLWVVAKRAWTSTLAKTSASTITANIEKAFKNPTFQKAILDQYRQLNSNQ